MFLKSGISSRHGVIDKNDLKFTDYLKKDRLNKVGRGILAHLKFLFSLANLASWYWTNNSLIALESSALFAPYTATLAASTLTWHGWVTM